MAYFPKITPGLAESSKCHSKITLQTTATARFLQIRCSSNWPWQGIDGTKPANNKLTNLNYLVWTIHTTIIINAVNPYIHKIPNFNDPNIYLYPLSDDKEHP